MLEGGFAGLGWSRYYAAALGICAVASYGVWLAVGALLLAAAVLRRQLTVADLPPWLALSIYLILMATLNDYALVGHNKWEIIHRPVVWVYFLLASWCVANGYRLLAGLRAPGSGESHRTLHRSLVVAALLLALLLPLRMGRFVQEGRSVWRFTRSNLRTPVGLVECARFLAHAGPASDVIQDSRCDDKLILGGLAEKRSYLARPEDWQRDKSAQVREEVAKRRAWVQRLLTRTNLIELHQAAEQTGIRWVLIHPDDDVRWPPALLEAPAFASNGFRVFDLAVLPLGSPLFNH